MEFKEVTGGVCAAKGFQAAGVHCGFRANPNKKDLALIVADVRRYVHQQQGEGRAHHGG